MTLWELIWPQFDEVPLLNRDEEISCVQHLRARDEQAEFSGQRLVEANLHLVVKIAERYANYCLLDLIQHSNSGLLQALQTFADSSENSFAAHASFYIDRAIADAIASPGGPAGVKYYPG